MKGSQHKAIGGANAVRATAVPQSEQPRAVIRQLARGEGGEGGGRGTPLLIVLCDTMFPACNRGYVRQFEKHAASKSQNAAAAVAVRVISLCNAILRTNGTN